MSILKDVNLGSKTGFLRDCASVFCRLPNRTERHSKRKDCHGAANRGRTSGRLLYRAALFLAGLQVLGLRPTTKTALGNGAARDVELNTKTGARSRGVEDRF